MIDYLLDRIFSVSNYEHGADEEQKTLRYHSLMEEYLNNLGLLDDVKPEHVQMVLYQMSVNYCQNQE